MGLGKFLWKLVRPPDRYEVEEDGAVRKNGKFVGWDRNR